MDSKSKQIKEELAWYSLAQPASNFIQSIRVLVYCKGGFKNNYYKIRLLLSQIHRSIFD